MEVGEKERPLVRTEDLGTGEMVRREVNDRHARGEWGNSIRVMDGVYSIGVVRELKFAWKLRGGGGYVQVGCK